MQAFRRDFLPNWRPPSGWRWQLVFGRTRLALHIGRDGTLRELEIVGEEGHKVLHDASVRAVERTAPFRPLPEDFPDEELVLGLELVYPRVRR
jgi:outer membrane biosynthesis protein TonB